MQKKDPNLIAASTSFLVKEILDRRKLVVPEAVHFFRRFLCYLVPYRLSMDYLWIKMSLTSFMP